jgi:hypothetical protein
MILRPNRHAPAHHRTLRPTTAAHPCGRDRSLLGTLPRRRRSLVWSFRRPTDVGWLESSTPATREDCPASDRSRTPKYGRRAARGAAVGPALHLRRRELFGRAVRPGDRAHALGRIDVMEATRPWARVRFAAVPPSGGHWLLPRRSGGQQQNRAGSIRCSNVWPPTPLGTAIRTRSAVLPETASLPALLAR